MTWKNSLGHRRVYFACLCYLQQGQGAAEGGAEGPVANEGGVWGDGDRRDAHHDVRHRHVHQVDPGVHPQVGPAVQM